MMDIKVTDIQKTESSILYADVRPMAHKTSHTYDISFTTIIQDHVINSNITIDYSKDLSFNKAEQIIKDILTGGDQT
ncbi:hypothetical protein GI584_14320 [Gracilibacillus salitolerans]|uniref:Uncharacterized protein n=1 Tax=Gracilibacillus salitolerans TaxID=2663022 RepID=A0A5Q2TM48_9BACI|nr:hypothetical protein [Gracilibacillus salitolerans]QGH35147.1 hypothetical protein GI584_14320 [Gracilibacillus salitolerans]